MTKLREPVTPHKTLHTVIGALGMDTVCAIVRRKPRSVGNWSDPDTLASVTLEAAFALDEAFMRAGGDHAPFATLYRARLEMIEAEIDATAHDRSLAAATLAKEAGDATAAQIIACRPGASRAEIAIAQRETRELIEAAAATLPLLDPDQPVAAATETPSQ
jgi:hypothetical protein